MASLALNLERAEQISFLDTYGRTDEDVSLVNSLERNSTDPKEIEIIKKAKVNVYKRYHEGFED